MKIKRTQTFEHYRKVVFSDGSKMYQPIVHDGMKRIIRRSHFFKKADPCRKWAQRFDRKLDSLRASTPRPPQPVPPVPDTTPVRRSLFSRLLSWLKSLLWRPA